MSLLINNKLKTCRRGRRVTRSRACRAAFTLIETMIAAMVTALVATAGTALVFAVSSGTTQTRDVRGGKSMGQYTLARIGRTVREARAIGEVTSTSVTLWAADTNQDDVINAGELGFIEYDSAAKQVFYGTLDPASGISPALPVSQSAFTDAIQLQTIVPDNAKMYIVWADNIETLTLTGYPSSTETRIVGAHLTIGTGTEAVAYQTTASPRAPADYLFLPQAQLPPNGPSGRQLRRDFSRWDGYGDISAQLPWMAPTQMF